MRYVVCPQYRPVYFWLPTFHSAGLRSQAAAGHLRRVLPYWRSHPAHRHRETLDAEVVLNVDSATVPLRQPRATTNRRCLQAGAPDHATGLDRAAVGEHQVSGTHFVDGSVELENHTVSMKDLACVIMCLRGERREQRGSALDQV